MVYVDGVVGRPYVHLLHRPMDPPVVTLADILNAPPDPVVEIKALDYTHTIDSVRRIAIDRAIPERVGVTWIIHDEAQKEARRAAEQLYVAVRKMQLIEDLFVKQMKGV
jgi:hypothetical protein